MNRSSMWSLLGVALLSAGTAPGRSAAQSAARPARDGSSCAHRAPGASAERSADSLAVIAQALLDAVGSGDTAVWTRYLADDGLFVDENGEIHTKRELVARIHPLPPGLDGELCVSAPRLVVSGSTAVLTYDALERETVYGQTLRTHYHTTDTYVNRGGAWRLFASHTAVLPSEHTAVAPPPTLGDYVGRYELAPGVTYTVTRDGAHLYGQRGDRPREELLPLGGDRFFRRGAPRGERIFRRDARGRVDAMIDRRDNNDLVWRRTG
ncbi:MAG TPA: DUF4440 domain-containing protein [Gemmatimonadaceae bacterium]